MTKYRKLVWANFLGMALYTLLYVIFSNEWKEGFPIGLAVYVTVHGFGLLLLSISQRVLKHFKMSKSAFTSGLGVLLIGWVMIFLVF